MNYYIRRLVYAFGTTRTYDYAPKEKDSMYVRDISEAKRFGSYIEALVFLELNGFQGWEISNETD